MSSHLTFAAPFVYVGPTFLKRQKDGGGGAPRPPAPGAFYDEAASYNPGGGALYDSAGDAGSYLDVKPDMQVNRAFPKFGKKSFIFIIIPCSELTHL
jgi:hypothetical protein